MATLVCLILDVGAHMYADVQQAVDCLRLLVQRDFFAKKKHEVALILCGIDSPTGAVALGSEIRPNIAIVRELAPLDWDILEFLNKESLLSSKEASVIDAISVAIRHLTEQSKLRKKVTEKRIILVSNLLGPATDSVADVLEACDATEVQLSLIGFSLDGFGGTSERNIHGANDPGPSSRHENQSDARSKLQPALIPITQLWRKRSGESYLFSEALPSLSLFEGRSIAQRGWKVDFQIGDTLSLPVEGFTQVSESRAPSLKHLYAGDPSTQIRPVTTYYTEKTNDEVDRSQVIRGYRYGSTVVSFSEEDTASVKQSSEKCLSLIGFTESSNVPRHLFVGNSVLVFVGSGSTDSESESSDPAAVALTALAQALFELDGVALVRRVYNRVSAPRLGVLTPDIHESQLVLVYTDLAFAEDVRNFEFPSLPIVSRSETGDRHGTIGSQSIANGIPSAPTAKQLQAMDQFVRAMTLGSRRCDKDKTEDAASDEADESDDSEDENDEVVGGDNIDLKPERVPNPWIQRLFACFRQRGLFPTEPLIPSTSHQSPSQTDHWLSTQGLPGLDRLISRLSPDPGIGSSEVLEARRVLLNAMPSLSPKHKPDEEGDLEGVAAKRRRLMAEELFGLDMKSNTTENSDHQATNSPSASGDEPHLAVSRDMIGDFEHMLSRGNFRQAHQFIERAIVRLVCNPFTPRLLRSRAANALTTYRQRAVQLSMNGGTNELALAYNSFLKEWKEYASGVRSQTDGTVNGSQASMSTSSDVESRRRFWTETISQGFGLITDSEVPGVGVNQAQADETNACNWCTESNNMSPNKFEIGSFRNLEFKDLVRSLIFFDPVCRCFDGTSPTQILVGFCENHSQISMTKDY